MVATNILLSRMAVPVSLIQEVPLFPLTGHGFEIWANGP
jgi:hypothetical protein